MLYDAFTKTMDRPIPEITETLNFYWDRDRNLYIWIRLIPDLAGFYCVSVQVEDTHKRMSESIIASEMFGPVTVKEHIEVLMADEVVPWLKEVVRNFFGESKKGG